MKKVEAVRSVFELLEDQDTPFARSIRAWLLHSFPKEVEQSAVQLVLQLKKLFEMAVFENEVDTVHILLQQGFPPDIKGDWGTTPLMWAVCLGYDQISKLLIGYGANQCATCFSGKTITELRKAVSSIEHQAILRRKEEIHDQVMAGCLKPLSSGTSDAGQPQNNKKNFIRQINNGKGLDELFKKIKSRESRSTKTVSFIVE